MAARKLNLSEWIARHIERIPESGCWIFMGCLTNRGYGVAQGEDTKKTTAHRYSYRKHIGEIPDGLFVCHRCDVKCCVNPAHLFLGTNQDNIDDYMRKGRNKKSNQTECIKGHTFSPDNTYINVKYGSKRQCRECKRNEVRSRRKRKRLSGSTGTAGSAPKQPLP